MASMVRKQVYLTVEQDRRLRQAAKKHRRTEAEIIRDALDRTLGASSPADPAGDALWELVATTSDGSDTLSEDVDAVVYGTRRK